MSTLLYSLGRWSYRHPWRVLASWLLLLLVVGGGALGLNKGFDNSFSIPGTESQEGLEQLSRTFPQVSGSSAQAIVVAADGDEVTGDSYRSSIEDAVSTIEDLDEVAAVNSPYDELVEGAISDDGTAAIIQIQVDGQSMSIAESTTDAITTAIHELGADLPSGSTTALGGELFSTELPTVTITEAFGVIVV